MTLSRRNLLIGAAAWGLRRTDIERPRPSMPGRSLDLELHRFTSDRTRDIVNAAIPLPPDFHLEPARIRATDSAGRELPLSFKQLEPWRIDGQTGTARAVHLQFEVEWSTHAEKRVHVAFDESPREARTWTPFDNRRSPAETVVIEEPRVLVTLPSNWMCASWVAGPQVPTSQSGRYAEYDKQVERSFPESLKYLDSDVYHHWLFDRPTCWYKQYIRTGDVKFLSAAYHAAHFMRTHTEMNGPDAGFFTLKGVDLKYVYPRAMHIHYLMTGDDRFLDAGKVMAAFCLHHWDPVYRPDRYTVPPLGTDPEKGRLFWSPRHQAYGLLGVLHGWELTGDLTYWRKAIAYVDALEQHQTHPPDGRPPDGSFRQNWALYDPNETMLEGATSPWMTAILLSALFECWLLTGDSRIPPMVTKACDFLDRRGFVADGSKMHYIVDCFGDKHAGDDESNPQEQGVERHSTEQAYSFAMGIYFSRDEEQRARFRRRFDRLFQTAMTIDANRPVRAYNWAFQSSSQMVYLMQQ